MYKLEEVKKNNIMLFFKRIYILYILYVSLVKKNISLFIFQYIAQSSSKTITKLTKGLFIYLFIFWIVVMSILLYSPQEL